MCYYVLGSSAVILNCFLIDMYEKDIITAKEQTFFPNVCISVFVISELH